MMKKQYIKRQIRHWGMAWVCAGLVWACAKDGLETAGGAQAGCRLSAYREQVATRAAQPDQWFEEGVMYRIWVTQPGETAPDIIDGETGYEGTEALREDGTHYINLRPIEASGEGNINQDFYGFTSADNTLPAENKVDGTYPIAREENADYTDYLRGELKYPYSGSETTGGILQMPFKHILSQVCLQASKSTEVEGEIEIVSVELMGSSDGKERIAKSGSYCVYENTFKIEEKENRKIELEDPLALPEDGTAKAIDTILIFPTFESEEQETMEAKPTYLRVKFKDPSNYYNFYAGQDGTKSIILPINDAGTGKPLVFKQNHSYTLQMTFMSDKQRIVMLVPQVLNWLEKEGSPATGWTTAEDLGQPVTFNGLLWSDRNLGATSGNPTRSVDDWYNSLGYIYQYGRNIPYYPFTVTNNGGGNYTVHDTRAGDAYKNNRLIYPVINPDSWGVQGNMGDNGKWYIHPVNNKNNGNPGLVWDLNPESFEDLYNRNPGYADFGYYIVKRDYKLSYLKGYNNDWANNTNTPCPPGWRLPTLTEFMSILPSSGFAGNITFRRFNGNVGDNGDWTAINNQDAEPNFESAFSKERIGEMTETPNSSTPAYKGFYPYIYREEKDDFHDGSNIRGQYVLSMAKGDRTQVKNNYGWLGRNASYNFNWGVIYGIKNQGTARAYRMKWSIRLMTDNPPTTNKEPDGSQSLVYPNNPFRGILVIERFMASQTDEFVPDQDGSYEASLLSYDWEHPVAVMYLPIGGCCDAEWFEGKIGNVGSEVWYATSELSETNGRKKIVWIKFAGSSSSSSQTITTSDRSQLGAAVFIRPVRDF